MTQAPFLLSREAWGYFEVRMEIVFNAGVQPAAPNKKREIFSKVNLYHMLDFSEKGNTRNVFLEINDEKNTAAVVKALTEKFGDLNKKYMDE